MSADGADLVRDRHEITSLLALRLAADLDD